MPSLTISDVIGAYYHYDQPAFGPARQLRLPASGVPPATCHGTFDAVSFAVDWQFAKKFDAYAGLYVLAGQWRLGERLSSIANTIDPTVKLRFRL